MPLIALILFIVAAVIFLVAALGTVHERVNLVALGLCVLTVGFICQFLIHGTLVS